MIEALIHSMTVCPEIEREYNKIEYGDGIYLYDNKGNILIDACSGKAGASNIGHGISEVGDLMRRQSKKISLYPSHFFTSEVVEEYLKNLVAFAPKGFERAWITTSGTDAIESAIKLAIQYHIINGEPSRFKIISRWGSYHGSSFYNLDVGGMKIRRDIFSASMFDFPHISEANLYRKPDYLSVEEYSQICSDELEKMIIKNGPKSIAAFIFEPVVAAALGAVPPPDDSYLKEIRRICDKYGVLLIADEVMTGFGRLGSNFGVNEYGVLPDIIASGKGISGGYFPMSAVIVNERISRTFINNNTYFLSGNTYACNPMAATVGNFTLKYIKENNLVERSKNMGLLLLSKLKRLLKFDIVGDVRGKGLLIGVEFVKCKETKVPFEKELNVSQRIAMEAINQGVVVYPGKGCVNSYQGDHILIMPPLIINEDHIEKIVSALSASIQVVSLELRKCK